MFFKKCIIIRILSIFFLSLLLASGIFAIITTFNNKIVSKEVIVSQETIVSTEATISKEAIVTTETFNTEAVAETSSKKVVEEPVLLDDPITFTQYQYKIFFNIEMSKDYIKIINQCIDELNIAIESKTYTFNAIEIMLDEKIRLEKIVQNIEADIELFTKWEEEHYYAAKAWEFFMTKGYSQEVAAGLIGNFMIETAGGTLDLEPDLYCSSGGHYGLCQWSKRYYPEVQGVPFEEQLIYLHNSMAPEFEENAYRWKKNFSLEAFMMLDTPEEAAAAFAKIYERPGHSSFGPRKKAAIKAYEYFYFDWPDNAEIVLDTDQNTLGATVNE